MNDDNNKNRGRPKDEAPSPVDHDPREGESGVPARRRLLQVLLGAGVITSGQMLPERWIKPVIESISLPAHAQTSPPEEEPDDDDDDDFDDDDDIIVDDDDDIQKDP